MTMLDYAKKCCDTVMKKFPQAELPPVGKFHYHAGVFLSGMERTYLLCGEEKYNQYIKTWIDCYVDAEGDIDGVDAETLDDIEPCNLLIRYYEGGEARYKQVLDKLAPLFLKWKCNTVGGFWHKEEFPNQMWLDGLYMAGPLAVKYGLMTGQMNYIELIHKQLKLMWENMRDEQSGLLYHAWDESKQEGWADSKTGCSPEFWGRAIGWYLVAAADISEMLPDENPFKKDFTDYAVSLAKAVCNYQDAATGLWFQVVDKGDVSGNWTETSCSCLFVYGISNLIRRGLLSKECCAVAEKAYAGIIEHKTELCGDELIIKDICIGTGVGDYAHYINRPRTENDLHGTGAFVLMCTEFQKLKDSL